MDVNIIGSGTVYKVLVDSEPAIDWVAENVDVENPEGFSVEHRYVGELTVGMIKAGLKVSVNGSPECFLNSAGEIVYNSEGV